MTVKDDSPPASGPSVPPSSDSGETTSLLSHSGVQPPSYQQSTSTSSTYPHQPIYPALPPPRRMGTPSGPSPYSSLPIPVVYEQESAAQAADRRARRRFFGALFWGFGIWLSVGLLTGGIVIDERSFRRGRSHRTDTVIDQPPSPPSGWDKCNGFTKSSLSSSALHPVAGYFFPSRTAVATFRVPLTPKDTLFLNAHGGWSHGASEFVVDDSLPHGSDALVTVVAKFDDASLLEESQICHVRKTNGNGYDSGIDIWTPERSWRSGNKQLTFDVVFRIPSSLSGLAGLNVSASIFRVSSPSLLRADAIDIKTSNVAIALGSLEAKTVQLKTSNAPVSLVRADADESISVQTSSGSIDGAFGSPSTSLKSSNGRVMGKYDVYGRLSLVTSNGAVDVQIALHKDKALDYDVEVHTTNARVDVLYLEQPRGGNLVSEVTSSNGRMNVRHHPEFAGSFELVSSNAATTVKMETTADPANPRRLRTLEFGTVSPKSKSGTVSWLDHDGVTKGVSKVKTSNAPATLDFA